MTKLDNTLIVLRRSLQSSYKELKTKWRLRIQTKTKSLWKNSLKEFKKDSSKPNLKVWDSLLKSSKYFMSITKRNVHTKMNWKLDMKCLWKSFLNVRWYFLRVLKIKKIHRLNNWKNRCVKWLPILIANNKSTKRKRINFKISMPNYKPICLIWKNKMMRCLLLFQNFRENFKFLKISTIMIWKKTFHIRIFFWRKR